MLSSFQKHIKPERSQLWVMRKEHLKVESHPLILAAIRISSTKECRPFSLDFYSKLSRFLVHKTRYPRVSEIRPAGCLRPAKNSIWFAQRMQFWFAAKVTASNRKRKILAWSPNRVYPTRSNEKVFLILTFFAIFSPYVIPLFGKKTVSSFFISVFVDLISPYATSSRLIWPSIEKVAARLTWR